MNAVSQLNVLAVYQTYIDAMNAKDSETGTRGEMVKENAQNV